MIKTDGQKCMENFAISVPQISPNEWFKKKTIYFILKFYICCLWVKEILPMCLLQFNYRRIKVFNFLYGSGEVHACNEPCLDLRLFKIRGGRVLLISKSFRGL